MRVVSIINQAGGVGKTTTALYLAFSLAELGKKVLFVDLDPQRSATKAIVPGIDFDVDLEEESGEHFNTIYTALSKVEEVDAGSESTRGLYGLTECIYNVKNNLDLVPGSRNLAAKMFEEDFKPSDKTIVKDELDIVKRVMKYDFCVMDTGPALSPLMINALVASDDIIIPVKNKKGLDSIIDLRDYYKGIPEKYRPRVAGVLVTECNERTVLYQSLRRLYEGAARKLYNSKVFDRCIRNCNAVAESEMECTFLKTYKKRCTANDDYTAFVIEYLRDLKALAKNQNGGK